MITELAALIFITSCVVCGVRKLTEEDHLLHFVRVFLDKHLMNECEGESKWFYKPILACVYCMASLYGVTICLSLLPFTLDLLWQIPFVCIGAVSFNGVIYNSM